MRTTVSCLLFIFSYTLLFATHNRAGEIIYEQTGPLTIQATIITYTQTSSIPADRDSLIICWGDGDCETLLRSNEAGEILENDYKMNAYTGSHIYTDLSTYTLSMSDPNRNGGVLNVNPPNSDQVQFHIQTTFTLRDLLLEGGTNQSPTLLIAPIDVGFVRQPFMHTPNAFDLDGDSVAYELVTPLMGIDENVPNYMSIDQIGAGIENSYTFNEQTGLLVWDSPQVVGQYNIAIKIKAFRDGELTDAIIRDMQILIQPDENAPPRITTTPEQNEWITLKAGKSVDFDFSVFDPEDGEVDGTALFKVSGESIQENTEIIQNPTLGILNGRFKWTPTLANIRTRPYQIVFKATDSQGFATFKVFRIQVVENSTSIPLTFQQLGFQLFPNPTTSQVQLTIPGNQVNQSAVLTIFDNLGRMVQQKQIVQTTTQETIEVSNLPSGRYNIQFLTVTTNASTFFIIR